MNVPLPLPNPGDWLTTAGAAYLMGCSRRTVDRLVERGVLTAYHPGGAPNTDPPMMLWREEVMTVIEARKRLRTAPARTDPLAHWRP